MVWYAAGERNAPGVYFAESRDKGHSFSARQLLSQETVRGTPALACETVAIWQGADRIEHKGESNSASTGSALSVAANAELPAATYANDKLFIAYILTQQQKRSIWLVRAVLGAAVCGRCNERIFRDVKSYDGRPRRAAPTVALLTLTLLTACGSGAKQTTANNQTPSGPAAAVQSNSYHGVGVVKS